MSFGIWPPGGQAPPGTTQTRRQWVLVNPDGTIAGGGGSGVFDLSGGIQKPGVGDYAIPLSAEAAAVTINNLEYSALPTTAGQYVFVDFDNLNGPIELSTNLRSDDSSADGGWFLMCAYEVSA